MSEFDCTRLVSSSSATVYGTPSVVPIPGTMRLKASSPYMQSKLCASRSSRISHKVCTPFLCHVEAASWACTAEPRWRAISLRYFNLAGAHPSGLIGEDLRGRPGNLLPLLAQMAIGCVKESTLQVFRNTYYHGFPQSPMATHPCPGAPITPAPHSCTITVTSRLWNGPCEWPQACSSAL
jgi:UDP-glucose 4-epimerase